MDVRQGFSTGAAKDTKLLPVVSSCCSAKERGDQTEGAQRGSAAGAAATGQGRAQPTDGDQEKAGFLSVFKAREKLLRTEE